MSIDSNIVMGCKRSLAEGLQTHKLFFCLSFGSIYISVLQKKARSYRLAQWHTYLTP